MVEASTDQQEAQRAHHYLVAVDGSEASDLAFSVAMDGLYRPKIDNFTVATVTNSKKENLPFNFKPEYLEDKYQAKIFKMSNMGKGHYLSREIDHVANKTTKETLYELSQEVKATVLVCGNHGRKGPKDASTYLGSTTKHMA
jgi:nucleotide-binding universal stress UspA family protein